MIKVPYMKMNQCISECLEDMLKNVNIFANGS